VPKCSSNVYHSASPILVSGTFWSGVGPPRGGSSRSGEGSSQARDRVGQAAHLEDPAGGVVVLGEHARVLEVPFSSNLLEAVQSRPPTGHPRPGLYAALMNGHTDLARFPMP
jgi:hypothetical protein